MLGSAGPGSEDLIATYIGGDEQTGREALRALARLGTPKAAAIVAAEIEKQTRPDERRGRRDALALSGRRGAAAYP